jgi:PPK2 family polyphosphate:nucleotide phosphotransferase
MALAFRAMATRDLRSALRVAPGTKVDLSSLDADATFGWKKKAAEEAIAAHRDRLTELQKPFWAGRQHALLVVLQGIDASGKDSTINRVMSAFDPQGCFVAGFREPTPEELAHDFLWRVHRRVPGRGEIGIFNRSHYEQVLVVRVHGLEPRRVWSRHYGEIRDFERLLVDAGTSIVKFFLHISRDEQRKRFQQRLDDPSKRWKFSMDDLAERALWAKYTAAFEDALERTSTGAAPWYVIPANRLWFRDLAIASVLADTLAELRPRFPPEPDLPHDLVIT